MKLKGVLITVVFLFTLFCCVQKNNQSRQFEKLMKIQALTTDGKEITVKLRNYYLFISNKNKLFDEKGYFLDENEKGDYLIEPILLSTVRSVIGRYNPTELFAKKKTELENELRNRANSISNETDEINKLNTQINSIILEEIIFSESAKESITSE